MTQAYLHEKLIEACRNGNEEDVKHWLDTGAEPNFNIRKPTNALYLAIQNDNHQIIELLLRYGAIVKEFVLQQAIEKDKNYLHLLVPNFKACKDKTLLIGALQAAINIGDVDLAKQAIHQGAKPESLYLYAIVNVYSIEILKLLIENGFNIHADKNMILTEWMGSTVVIGWGDKKSERYDLLAFISSYYLEKSNSIVKFKSLRLPDKSLIFRIGLSINNLDMMKFAVLIGFSKNNALNSALYQHYAYKQGNKSEKVDYEIIDYLLNSNIEFKKATISNAVCFKYTELLNALSRIEDLEYGYEMAYKYQNDDLCEYFIHRGVSYEAQSFAKMKVSAIKGDIKELRSAINGGAKVEALDTDVIVEIINKNQVETLKYLYDSGVLLDTSLNKYLDNAMRHHKAYETISYFIELGLDITHVKNIPREYKKRYPALADMWEKRFRDIFDYTIYLAKDAYPKADGKEKEEILKRIAELSTLPYVIKRSQGKLHEH